MNPIKKIRRVYLHTDIEGIAGYVHYASFSSSLWNYHHVQRMNRLLTREVNAAALGCKDAGAEEVLVNDSHGACYNIIFEDLDPVCRIIHGRSGHAPSWIPCLDETIDAAIAIGMHARAGTPKAVCNHTLWHLTDGEGRTHHLSEAAIFALLCATKNVPLAAVSGDQHVCEEVLGWVPECPAAIVKESLGLQFANSLHPEKAGKLIRERVTMGLRNAGDITIPSVAGPYALNLSDRDPSRKVLEEPMRGESLWELIHAFCNAGYARFGVEEAFDDGEWRYPDSVHKPLTQ